MNSLADFLFKYSFLRLATYHDSDEILDFFDSKEMELSDISLQYIRYPNFFSFLEKTSDRYYVFVNSEGPIRLVATVTIRKAFIQHEIKDVAYLGDFRATLGGKLSRLWKIAFDDLILNFKSIKEFNTDLIFTAILKDNLKAKKVLVDRAYNNFQYELITDYQMINILDTFKQSVNFQISLEDINDEMIHFIESFQKKSYAGYHLDLIKRNSNKALLCRDKGDILGIAFLSDPSDTKKIIVQDASFKIKLLNSFFSLLTNTPEIGEELKILYLSFISIPMENNRDEILASMIAFLKRNKVFDQYHMLSFANFEKDKFNLRYLLSRKSNLELYQVVNKISPPSIVGELPSFEISLV